MTQHNLHHVTRAPSNRTGLAPCNASVNKSPNMPLACANQDHSGFECSSLGKLACGNCRLVAVNQRFLLRVFSGRQRLTLALRTVLWFRLPEGPLADT